MKFNTFRNGRVHVCERMCDTCIFRPGNLMSLSPGTVEGMVKSCLKNGLTIPCHDTLHTKPKTNAICRGFWNRYKEDIITLQLAEAFGVVVWQKVKKK